MFFVDNGKGMSQINPFAGAIAQTPAAQQKAAAERSAQVRKTHEKQKTTGLIDQPVDEFVESADAVNGVGDEDHHPEFNKKKKSKNNKHNTQSEDKPHIDLTA